MFSFQWSLVDQDKGLYALFQVQKVILKKTNSYNRCIFESQRKVKRSDIWMAFGMIFLSWKGSSLGFLYIYEFCFNEKSYIAVCCKNVLLFNSMSIKKALTKCQMNPFDSYIEDKHTFILNLPGSEEFQIMMGCSWIWRMFWYNQLVYIVVSVLYLQLFKQHNADVHEYRVRNGLE